MTLPVNSLESPFKTIVPRPSTNPNKRRQLDLVAPQLHQGASLKRCRIRHLAAAGGGVSAESNSLQDLFANIIQGHLFGDIDEAAENEWLTNLEYSEDPLALRLAEFVEDGHGATVKKVATRAGFPWDQIREVDCPVEMRQLVLLEEVLSLSTDPALQANHQQVIDYALELVDQQEEPEDVLAAMVYLADAHPARFATAMAKGDQMLVQAAREEIRIKFDEAEARALAGDLLGRKMEERADHTQLSKLPDLQSSENLRRRALPVEISDALLTSHGKVNTQLVPLLEEFLCGDQPWETHIRRVLDTIVESNHLEALIDETAKPEHPETVPNEVIRAALRLSPYTPITERHARLTCLSGVLTQLRQGSAGSCFATGVAIQEMTDDPIHVYEDFADLIQYGFLDRSLGDSNHYQFPMLAKLSPDGVGREIRFSKDGNLDGKRGKALWNVPGLVRALNGVGIRDVKGALLPIAKELGGQRVSAREVLRVLANQLCEANPLWRGEPSDVLEKLAYYFEAEVSHPLLRGWEYCVASMAEVEGIFLFFPSAAATTLTLQEHLRKKKIGDKKDRLQVLDAVWREMIPRMQSVYDPSIYRIDHNEEDLRGSSGFVLYDTHKKDDFRSWTRIDSPQEYRGFVLELLEEVRDRVGGNCMELDSDEELSDDGMDIDYSRVGELIDPLRDYVSSDAFMLHAVRRAANDDDVTKKDIVEYHTLDTTPWYSKSGHRPEFVLRVYYEGGTPFAMEQGDESIFDPVIKFINEEERSYQGTPRELLVKIISEIKRAPEETQEKLAADETIGLDAMAPGHAFIYLPSHPTLRPAWESELSPLEWVNENVTNPGQAALSVPITRNTVKSIVKLCVDNFIPKRPKPKWNKQMRVDEAAHKSAGPLLCGKDLTPLSGHEQQLYKERVATFKEAIAQLPCDVSVQQFYNEVLKLLVQSQPRRGRFTRKQIESNLTGPFFKELPVKVRKELLSTAVHIADANWNAYGYAEDFHFCIMNNMGTGKPDVWEISTGETVVRGSSHDWMGSPGWNMKSFERLRYDEAEEFDSDYDSEEDDI